MKIIYTKSSWEMSEAPLGSFLARARSDGFEAVEINLSGIDLPPAEIDRMVRDHGLKLVAQIITSGASPDEHRESLERLFAFAVETDPVLINSHTGSDVFPFEDSLGIFEHGCELSRRVGKPLTYETHRSRPTGSGPMTRKFLESLPAMRITADFSHWFCVHESDLSDQTDHVELAIRRSAHLHARVGFAEGPQVPDPLAPQWEEWTQLHLSLWRRIVETRKAAGEEFLTVTPEFGPPPYMPVEPHTGRPLADAWDVNVRFFRWLQEHLGQEV